MDGTLLNFSFSNISVFPLINYTITDYQILNRISLHLHKLIKLKHVVRYNNKSNNNLILKSETRYAIFRNKLIVDKRMYLLSTTWKTNLTCKEAGAKEGRKEEWRNMGSIGRRNLLVSHVLRPCISCSRVSVMFPMFRNRRQNRREKKIHVRFNPSHSRQGISPLSSSLLSM